MGWRRKFGRFAKGRREAEPTPGNIVFDQFIESQRARMLRAWRANGQTSASAGVRRAVSERIRAIRKEFKFRPRQRIPVDVLAFRAKPSFLVDHLQPARLRNWLMPLKRSQVGAKVDVRLSRMSFLDEPAQTLESIRGLLKAETGAREVRVHFDDERCLDVAPYLLLAMLWRELVPIFTGGRMTPEIQKLVEAVQLRKPLKMARFRHVADDHEMRAFPLHRRRAANTSRSATRYLDPQTSEEVQDAFVASIDDWLAQEEIDQQLTPAGRGQISNIIGEILDNAERHSMPHTMDGDWTIAGFMARRDDPPGVRFECSIAFISVGATISEGLDTSPPSVAAEVSAYVDTHRRRHPEELLRTIMSLQDGITRVAKSADANRGGTGLQDVLDLVGELGDDNLSGCGPKVTIVSGSACLKLHGTHSKGARTPGDPFSPRQVWFNAANDSADAPDPAYAFSLPQSFPGTIVTMSFVFEPTVKDGK